MNMDHHRIHWYVVYTRPRTERKVVSSVSEMGIETFLPMYKVVRQWSDRKKKLNVPLFPNYVFVRISPEERQSIYSIKEVVRFVSFEKKPVIVRDQEILLIKQLLNCEADVMPDQYFSVGTMVRICSGPFSGLEGVVIKRNSRTRLIIKIEGFMKAFSFNVSGHQAEVVRKQEMSACP